MVADLRFCIVLFSVFVTVSLVLGGASNVIAQMNGLQSFFSAKYVGVSIRVDASGETVPGGNTTIALAINATAEGVRIEYLNVSVYGFINGSQQVLLNSTTLMSDATLQLHETAEFDSTIGVPSDVWGMTYGQIFLRYTIEDQTTERTPGFPLTTIRNIYLENLQSQLQSLNQSHSMLSEIFKKLTTEYGELDANYTALLDAHAQDSNDLYGTRTVAVILTITTVFFVATTFYLVMRRPKDYW